MSNTQLTPQQMNAAASSAVRQNALEMTQNIFSTTVASPASNPTLNIPVRNVGLIKGFLLEVSGTLNNTGSTTAATPTDFNIANVLQQIVFLDFQNNTRINTTGWHINFLNTAKHRRVFGSSVATDVPIKYGSNYKPFVAPTTIAAGANAPFSVMYWIPLAYSDDDLRGAVYAAVTNATATLQLSFNQNVGTASGDSTLQIMTGNTCTMTNVTVNVYQNYLDQLPVGQSGVILPILDLSTIYELKNTTFSALVAGQDFPIPFANYRQFLSTFQIYDQAGTRVSGTDINYFSLQAANTLNIWKQDPLTLALNWRRQVSTDFPPGTSYFSYRHRPLSTIQYGNLNLIINPITAAAGSTVLVGFEAFALINALQQAGSLPAS